MDIQQLFKKIKQLPIIPKLMHELMNSFGDDNSNISLIAGKIAMDQVISAKVLRMANSAAYRRGKEVTSVEQAVIRLGFERLRSLVVAASLSSGFKISSGFDIQKYWTDTFQVATIARTLGSQCPEIEPETAFTCALLHDIGELLIQSALPDEAALIAAAMGQGASRVEAQRELLDFDYSDVGAELARQWNLSDTFVQAISQQLNPLEHDPVSPEAVLIRLAVFVSFAWNAGVPAHLIVQRFPKPLANHLKVDPEELAPQLEELHEQGNALADMLTS